MKRLEPTSQTFTIHKPSERYPSEFEVQAYLFSSLKQLGLDVRGEVNHRTEGRLCRFDLVLFKGDQATAIIEVKNESERTKPGINLNGRQCTRYREYGVPVYFIRGMHQAGVFIERCKLQADKREIPQ